MVRVALPSFDIHTLNGRATGVGTFLYQFSKLLTANGDDVTLIATHHDLQSTKVDEPWRKIYDSLGINLLYVHNDPYEWHCGSHLIALSKRLAPTLEQFDVAYFMDWANVAFHTVRAKRFTTRKMPVCVTVTHAPSNWCRPSHRKYVEGTEDLHIDFMERYSAEHSDFVACPSQAMLDFVRNDGWNFKREPKVLGLPVFPYTENSEIKPAEKIKRLVCFGRVETTKNFDLFVKAVLRLSEIAPEALNQIEEIVFLGQETEPGSIVRIREELKPVRAQVIHLGNHDNVGANKYLATVAGETLTVIASLYENLTYAGIEASMIPGLNLICTNGGGTPEIFRGKGEKQLFEPTIQGLSAKMLERLKAPLAPDQLIKYDYKAANDKWLAFHREVCEQVRSPETVVPKPSIGRARLEKSQGFMNGSNSGPATKGSTAGHSVDVCVTFFNKQRYFEQTLRSLENQTSSDFSVIAVDDGSTDPSAIKLFESMAQKYASRGWTFFRQDNRFVDAARNEAARRGQAKYLFMLDADDVITPDAIDRLLEAARLSGDDFLVTGSCWFKGDEYPLDAKTGQVTAPIEEKIIPVGPNISAALYQPWILGGSAILIRRDVFESVGGYRELHGVQHEDWELQLRIAFAGYRIDVVPEYLYLYRRTDDSLSREVDNYRASRRLIDTYNQHLATIDIHNGGDMMFRLHQRCQELEQRLSNLAMQSPLVPANSSESESEPYVEDSSSFNDELLRRFGSDDKGPPLIRQLRRIYRTHMPLNTRLKLHEMFAELTGRR